MVSGYILPDCQSFSDGLDWGTSVESQLSAKFSAISQLSAKFSAISQLLAIFSAISQVSVNFGKSQLLFFSTNAKWFRNHL